MISAAKKSSETSGTEGVKAPANDPKIATIKKEKDEAYQAYEQQQLFTASAKAKWEAKKNHPMKKTAMRMLDDRLEAAKQKYLEKSAAYEKTLKDANKKPAYDKSTSIAKGFGGSYKKHLAAYLALHKKPTAPTTTVAGTEKKKPLPKIEPKKPAVAPKVAVTAKPGTEKKKALPKVEAKKPKAGLRTWRNWSRPHASTRRAMLNRPWPASSISCRCSQTSTRSPAHATRAS